VVVGSEVIGNLNLGWTSSSEIYSVNAYVRNVADTIYKTNINVVSSFSISAFPSDPRTYGVVLGARF
jgi:outer membrane receptor protein involved in Fe transport